MTIDSLAVSRRLREGVLIITIAISLFILAALITYHTSDPGWSHVTSDNKTNNLGGHVGAFIADILFSLFGYLSYILPLLLIQAAWLNVWEVSSGAKRRFFSWKTLGFLLILAAGSSLISLFIHLNSLPLGAGGLLGDIMGDWSKHTFNGFGAKLFNVAFLLVGMTLFLGISWLSILDYVGKQVLQMFSRKDTLAKISSVPVVEKKIEPRIELSSTSLPVDDIEPPTVRKQKIAIKAVRSANGVEEKKLTKISHSDYLSPSLELLDLPDNKNIRGQDEKQLNVMAQAVELRLREFAIDAKVVAVHPGPVITRFELQLAAGTKVSKISSLAKDLARSLSVNSVRIVEIIQGKPVIGLEIPNEQREVIRLREILSSKQYQHTHALLAIALGKDIAGNPVVVDLARMPHLLIAGTTGSGKSVGLNAILISLLYKYSPEELRLILIDPKMLELAIYDGIPHLLTEVVTDMKDASLALRWCVAEMERRYRLMAALGVRNIVGFNAKVQEAEARGKPLFDPLIPEDNEEFQKKELTKLPYIIVIADEFADMMIVVGKKIEELITRIAQKARAAGIHVIFATQRPSVDVITGLIKANIPSRIAFQVSSKVDSRTILDQMGAEQLLGNGDMLYLPPGTAMPIRVHGAFVADDEVHRVAEELKKNGVPEYLADLLEEGNNISIPGVDPSLEQEYDDAEKDPLYDHAAQFVVEARKVSTSSIQRRFKIGYNRAARIVEAMENAGIVSKMESNGYREVLVPNREE